MVIEQFQKLVRDMTEDELESLKEWDCGSYWGNKSAIDIITAELSRRAAAAQHDRGPA